MRPEVTTWLSNVERLMLRGIELFLASGQLVAEAFEGGYHVDLGFSNMEEYINKKYEERKFPCQSREALERCKVWRGAKKLKIPKGKLTCLSAIQLKDIFSLDVEQYGDKIKELLDEAVFLDMAATKVRVKAIKSGKTVAEVTQAAEDKSIVAKGETASSAEKADLYKFAFTFTKQNGALVERALALFGTDKKDAMLKMCAEALANHTPKAVDAPVEEEAKVMAAGA